MLGAWRQKSSSDITTMTAAAGSAPQISSW